MVPAQQTGYKQGEDVDSTGNKNNSDSSSIGLQSNSSLVMCLLHGKLLRLQIKQAMNRDTLWWTNIAIENVQL